MKVSVVITSYSESESDTILKILSLLFCRLNNQAAWYDGNVIMDLFNNYFNSKTTMVTLNQNKLILNAIKHMKYNLIPRSIMKSIEILHVFDDHKTYNQYHTQNITLTIEKIQEFYKSIGFNNYKFIISNERTSLGTSRNVAAKNAAGEYIFFIDDDDMYVNLECLYNTLVNSLKASDYDVIVYDNFVIDIGDNNINLNDFRLITYTQNKWYRTSLYNCALECSDLYFETIPVLPYIYSKHAKVYVNASAPKICVWKYNNRITNTFTFIPFIKSIELFHKHMHTDEERFINLMLLLFAYLCSISKNHALDKNNILTFYNTIDNIHYRLYNEHIQLISTDVIQSIKNNTELFESLTILYKTMTNYKREDVNILNTKNNNEVYKYMLEEFSYIINMTAFKDDSIHVIHDTFTVNNATYTYDEFIQMYTNQNKLCEFDVIDGGDEYKVTHSIGNDDDDVREYLEDNELTFDFKNNDFITREAVRLL